MREQIAVQNAGMEKENAELEADLDLLAHTREIAATEAAIETLQLEEEKVKELMNIPLVPKRKLTEKYVHDLPEEDYNTSQLMSQFPSQHVNPGQSIIMTSQQSQFEPHAFVHQSRQPQNESIRPARRTSYQEQTTVDQNRGLATDFTRFLLKKDLLLSRLCSFTDKAEMFPSWKSSFKNVVHEIGATPSEEIDLLVKYTGGISQKYVLSLRAAHTKRPAIGLMRIWERLEERYGSP